MTTIPGLTSMGSTYRPALALLALFVLLTVADVKIGPSPIYQFVFWLALTLCFLWIFKILQRAEFGPRGKPARLIVQLVTATVLTLVYGYFGVIVAFNFYFLIGGVN